jgi:hypothetical protein
MDEMLSILMFVDLKGVFGTAAHIDRASVFTAVRWRDNATRPPCTLHQHGLFKGGR